MRVSAAHAVRVPAGPRERPPEMPRVRCPVKAQFVTSVNDPAIRPLLARAAASRAHSLPLLTPRRPVPIIPPSLPPTHLLYPFSPLSSLLSPLSFLLSSLFPSLLSALLSTISSLSSPLSSHLSPRYPLLTPLSSLLSPRSSFTPHLSHFSPLLSPPFNRRWILEARSQGRFEAGAYTRSR